MATGRPVIEPHSLARVMKMPQARKAHRVSSKAGTERPGTPDVALVEEPPLDTRTQLGQRLRGLRQRRGLTIAEVAAATRMSKSFLALLERGKTEIAVSRLIRIADFFGVWFDDLLGLPRPAVSVVPAAQVRQMLSHSAGVDLRVLTTSSASSIQPFVLRLKHSAMHAGLPHEGQLQFTHVIEGTVRLEVGGGSYRLAAGDTIYFPSRLAHLYVNDATADAVVVGAVVRSGA